MHLSVPFLIFITFTSTIATLPPRRFISQLHPRSPHPYAGYAIRPRSPHPMQGARLSPSTDRDANSRSPSPNVSGSIRLTPQDPTSLTPPPISNHANLFTDAEPDLAHAMPPGRGSFNSPLQSPRLRAPKRIKIKVENTPSTNPSVLATVHQEMQDVDSPVSHGVLAHSLAANALGSPRAPSSRGAASGRGAFSSKFLLAGSSETLGDTPRKPSGEPDHLFSHMWPPAGSQNPSRGQRPGLRSWAEPMSPPGARTSGQVGAGSAGAGAAAAAAVRSEVGENEGPWISARLRHGGRASKRHVKTVRGEP